MKVFISHTFQEKDKSLAEMLQKILSQKGIIGYIAEKERQYTLLISEKIQKRIKESDHVVAIITEDALASASVNQELGYAIREGINPIIMMEKIVKKMGVLIYGRDPEVFTRENFEQSCINIRDFLIGTGSRAKITDKDLEYLQLNVYTPIFNKIADIFTNPDNRRKPPEDFLKNLVAFDKLKLESDVEEILQNYTKARNKWAELDHTLNSDYADQQEKLVSIISQVFASEGLLDDYGSIIFTSNSGMAIKDWLGAFSSVVVDTRIKNAEEFYEKLMIYSKEIGIGHERWLKQFRDEHPNLFQNIFNVLPELRKNFNTKFSNEDWEKVKENTFNLLKELEEKLKTKLVNF